MKIKCIIGIDLGSQGGISVYQPGQTTTVFKMPKNIKDLIPFFNDMKHLKPLIFMEKVQLQSNDMHGGKAFNVQKLLNSFERLKMVLEMSELPFILVHPMTWQKELKLRIKDEEKADRKKRYKAVAQNAYPELKATLWNCDALLICHFGRFAVVNKKEWIISNLPERFKYIFS